jgi:predicted esterase
MKRWVAFIGKVLAAGVVVVAVIILYLNFKDYRAYFVERKGILQRSEVQAATGDSARARYWLTLRSESGLTAECGMLVPCNQIGKFPAIILLGGKATGKYAIDNALGINNVVIVAVDYPYTPRESYSMVEFLADVPAMRQALIDMVPSVMLLMDYLCQRDDVDTSKIVLLGYSFGAPLVPSIIANDRRPAVAAMVYGGGDLYSLIRHNVRRYEGPLLSEVVAQLGGLLLRPVEPLRYVESISPIPLLMINGTHDEQIPRTNTELLYAAAKEPRKIIWIDSQHVNPRNVELTRRIVRHLSDELTTMGILLPSNGAK